MKLFLTSVVTVAGALFPLAAGADIFDVLFGTAPPGVSGIPDVQPQSYTIGTIISNIMGFAFGLLIILAALFIVVAAYLYLTSGGNTEKVGTAHKFIIYAVVALVAAALSQTIVFIVAQLIGF